jgi:hypothetical protein
MKNKKYPFYVNHREYNEPRRVDNLGELNALKAQGWTESRLWKEYPKMVNGIICKDADQEKLLLDHAAKMPKVEVKKTILGEDGLPADPDMHKLVDKKPTAKTRGKVQVSTEAPVKDNPVSEMAFEIVNGENVVIPDLQFPNWAEAQATQKELNKNSPGHKARKIIAE